MKKVQSKIKKPTTRYSTQLKQVISTFQGAKEVDGENIKSTASFSDKSRNKILTKTNPSKVTQKSQVACNQNNPQEQKELNVKRIDRKKDGVNTKNKTKEKEKEDKSDSESKSIKATKSKKESDHEVDKETEIKKIKQKSNENKHEEDRKKKSFKKLSEKPAEQPRMTRSGEKGKARNFQTDIYKSRHNIGKRVAAGRVCSYKETEISLVFPDNYWALPSCKVDFALSSSDSSESSSASSKSSTQSDSSDSEISEDDEVHFNFEAQKKREEKQLLVKNKQAVQETYGRKGKTFEAKTVSEKTVSGKKNNSTSASRKSTDKAKTDSTKKAKNQKIMKKRKSVFEDIKPRAPRIQRTACLNASAINSLMYDYSVASKKTKVEKCATDTKETLEVKDSTTDDDFMSDTEESESENEEEESKFSTKKRKSPPKSKTSNKKGIVAFAFSSFYCFDYS